MAYKVRMTLTRGDNPFQVQDSSFIAETTNLMAANNITAERNTNGNVLTIVYTAPTQADYDNFYDAMVPRWADLGTMAYAESNGITINTEVIENT